MDIVTNQPTNIINLNSARGRGLVKRRLKALKISHFDIARLAGVHDVTVWRVLAGRRKSARVQVVIKELLA